MHKFVLLYRATRFQFFDRRQSGFEQAMIMIRTKKEKLTLRIIAVRFWIGKVLMWSKYCNPRAFDPLPNRILAISNHKFWDFVKLYNFNYHNCVDALKMVVFFHNPVLILHR